MKASLFNFEILKEGHKLIFCIFFRIFSNTESPPDPISPFQPFPKVFSALPEDANEPKDFYCNIAHLSLDAIKVCAACVGECHVNCEYNKKSF